MRAAPSQEEVRRQNLGALLGHVHRHGPMSRAELTARLGLNRSTIGALTTDLAAARLVTERPPPVRAGRGDGTGRAGRPSLVVAPRSDTVHVYALSVEVDRVRAARVGLGGVVLDQRSGSRSGPGPDEDAAATAAAFVAEMHAAAPAGTRCVGAGVATSRRRAGGAGDAPGLLDQPVPAALVAALPAGAPVAFGAVADLAALAEHTRGVAVGHQHMIYLYGTAGIAAGIVVDGRRISGSGGAAGEVGHMVVHPGGRRCWCGAHGCWETEAGDRALLRAAGRAETGGRDAVRAVVDAAARGDAPARDAVRQVGDWLGLGVANLVNIVGPEMIIFGESLRDIYLAAAAPVRSRLNATAAPGGVTRLRLRTPALGDDAPLLGAAELAFETLLTDPLDAPACP